jgi:hypothetical protein
MVLTAYSALSLVIGLSCHHPRCDCEAIVVELTSASRCQDHAALPSACWRIRLAHQKRPPHPAPNVRDDRDTPLLWARDARSCRRDLPDGLSELFLLTGLDGHFAKLPDGQISAADSAASRPFGRAFIHKSIIQASDAAISRPGENASLLPCLCA